MWRRCGNAWASGYIRTRKYTVRTGACLTRFLKPGSGVPQGGAEGPFLYLLVTRPLALIIEQDYPAYAPYPLLSPLVGFADDTNLTAAHIPHEPQTADSGPTVTQQTNDLLDVTIPYLSHNNLIVHPTKSVAMIKGSATPPTPGPQGPPMQVVTTTTHLGVFQAANPEDATLPPRLQSHLAHLPRYASGAAFTSIPTRATRAAWPHYGDAIGDEVKAAYTRHTALLLHRMTNNHSPEVREGATIRL